jgi:predicted phosphodiesterase
MMKIVVISDTHMSLGEVLLPGGDVLIHCGDLLSHGTYKEFYRELSILRDLKKDYQVVLYCPGNHDFYVQENQSLVKEACLNAGITLLLDKRVIINGIKFYGTPWTPIFYDWAFNASHAQQIELFSQIPEDTDILVTHGPAYGILDLTCHHEKIGSQALLDKIQKLRNLKYHLFGHCHYSYGTSFIETENNKYIAANCATCGEDYNPTNLPFTFHIKEVPD